MELPQHVPPEQDAPRPPNMMPVGWGVHIEKPTRSVPVWLWVVTAVLLVVVVLLQRPGTADPKHHGKLVSGEIVEPIHVDPSVAGGKLALALDAMQKGSAAPIVQILAGDPQTGANDQPAQDRFRAAILVGEIEGESAMDDQFDSLLQVLDEKSPLREDIQTVREAHDEAAAAPADPAPSQQAQALSPAQQALIARHGWFGRLALDWPKPAPGDPDPFRDEARSDGTWLVMIAFVVLLFVLFAFCLGIGLLIAGAVTMSRGLIRSAWPPPVLPDDGRPSVPPRILLETFAVFLAGFLALKLVATVAAIIVMRPVQGQPPIDPPEWLVWLTLVGQWALAPIIFWPLLRGVKWKTYQRDLGWNTGRGALREVGAGLATYFASFPVYVLIATIVIILWYLIENLLGNGKPPVPENRVVELASGSVAEMIVVFSLASMWAPMVEETIFRGVLYRLFRGRSRIFLAVAGSAAIFAAMHGYMVAQLFLIGSLGIVFALMREWRGSLIPSMTAHCLHNTMIFSMLIVVLSFSKS